MRSRDVIADYDMLNEAQRRSVTSALRAALRAGGPPLTRVEYRGMTHRAPEGTLTAKIRQDNAILKRALRRARNRGEISSASTRCLGIGRLVTLWDDAGDWERDQAHARELRARAREAGQYIGLDQAMEAITDPAFNSYSDFRPEYPNALPSEAPGAVLPKHYTAQATQGNPPVTDFRQSIETFDLLGEDPIPDRVCHGQTRKGKRCCNAVKTGELFCHLHQRSD